MESTLPLPFLIGVDIPPGLAKSPGLSREEVSVLGVPFLEATSAKLEKLSRYLRRHNYEFHTHLDATDLVPEDVISLLDQGARTIFVAPEQLSKYSEFGSRVLPTTSKLDLTLASDHGLLITNVGPLGQDTEQFVTSAVSKNFKTLYLKPASTTSITDIIALAKKCHAIPILPSSGLTTNKSDSTKYLISNLFANFWVSDRQDELIPTVITTELGVSLGLAYTSQDSILEAVRTQGGVYQSRKRGLWIKGASSGDTQELIRIGLDCDQDTLRFTIRQKGRFCHLEQQGCFGELTGVSALEQVLKSRKESAPEGSYTARLFSDEKLLRAKIMEEAEELCDANTPEGAAFEAADLIYFALTKAIILGASMADISANLDAKALKVKRRPGNAKERWSEKSSSSGPKGAVPSPNHEDKDKTGRIGMRRLDASAVTKAKLSASLKRPSQKSPEEIMKIVTPIIDAVRSKGDEALLSYTHKFEKALSLTSPVLKAPFPKELMKLPLETIEAIDISFANVQKFHAAQREETTLKVETMEGVVCSRFSRPIEKVGLYVPGGTAVLPSSAIMLGVPAKVAGCKSIVLASPPRSDGSLSPEIVYIAHRVGAESIVLAGGAQAIAAMAYGTESVTKVDKILGPGNQFVTAAKMHVSNDTNAGVSIDMPAGPSEVLVVADNLANASFVAADLLSQAEHGVDSQVVLIAVDMSEDKLREIEDELHQQAMALPRVDIVRGAIAHSITVQVKTIEEAMEVSNEYAPEHLILQVQSAAKTVDLVMNAGSVFIGQWTPESVGDYSAGVNHSLRKLNNGIVGTRVVHSLLTCNILATYGFAKQYSGVNLGSFTKHITSANLTAQGLRNLGPAVMQLAKVEQLEAHRRAVDIRIQQMKAL